MVMAPVSSSFVSLSSSGWYHACGITTSGTIECWGLDNTQQASPPTGTTFVLLSTGGYHTCAQKTDGRLQCWGYDYHGQTSPPGGRLWLTGGRGD